MEDHHLDSVCPLCDVKLGIVGALMHTFGFMWITNDKKLFLPRVKLPHLSTVLKYNHIMFHFSIVGRK